VNFSWSAQIYEVSKLEATLEHFPNVRDLSLNIGTETALTPKENVITLDQLPIIIKKRCPLTERLKITYRRSCSLWEFAEHLDGIFQMELLSAYEFEWGGGGNLSGIKGFMGDYDSSEENKNRAVTKLFSWEGLIGDRVQVSLKGVCCSACQDPTKGKSCPHPEICTTLNTFLEMCHDHHIPLKRI